jgi:hypothetical protein
MSEANRIGRERPRLMRFALLTGILRTECLSLRAKRSNPLKVQANIGRLPRRFASRNDNHKSCCQMVDSFAVRAKVVWQGRRLLNVKLGVGFLYFNAYAPQSPLQRPC